MNGGHPDRLMECTVRRTLGLTALGLLLVLPYAPWAAQPTDAPGLSRLEARIEGEKADLAKLRSRESSVLALLETIDREFDQRNLELARLNERIEALVEEMETTAADMTDVSNQLETGRKAFSRRARALYKWQRWGSPFVLLTGDVSVLELMRRKRHLEIVLEHDRNLVQGLARRTAELDRLRHDLEEQRAALQQERRTVVTLRASVRRERERKRAALYAIQREVRLRSQTLEELERAARELQQLIERRGEAVEKERDVEKPGVAVNEPVSGKDAARPTADAEPWDGFAHGRGRFELPVRGKIIGGFGRRQHPDLKVEVDRKGLDIAALEGEDIRAVARGEVIFSNRLSGYGRMVIIDHGERYYTVYAHLSTLYKKVGDRVERGERIAAVGDSGTFGPPRLYFEVRKDGRPIDPAPWFKKAALRNARAKSDRGRPAAR